MTIFLWLSPLAALIAQAAPVDTLPAPRGDAIHYRLRLLPAATRTDLQVEVRYRPDSLDGPTVALPRDIAYGFPVAGYVAGLEALPGTTLSPGPDSLTRRVVPGPDGTVQLRYRLAFTFEDRGSATYAPSTSARHLHLAAAQWMLGIGPAGRRRGYMIRFAEAGAGWHRYNSLGADPGEVVVTGSRQGLSRAMQGGAATPVHRFAAPGGEVRVHTPGGFRIPVAELGPMVERIIRPQRERFGPGGPFFDVVLLPRPDNIAGVATSNGFVAFVRAEVSRPELAMLLSHEMLHAWMNDDVFPVGPESLAQESFLRSRWFVEGVNDFTARELLRDAGLLTEAAFVDLANRDLINLADHPHRAATLADAVRAADSGRYDVAWTKLHYYRGGVIALGWAATLRRRNGGTLAPLLAALHREVAARKEPLTYDEFFAYFARAGLDARADEAHGVLRGEALVPADDALGPRWSLRDSLVPAFDPGFDLAASRAAKRLVGVVAGGPAERAGARDGMPIVAMANDNRWAYAWMPAAPLVVDVRDGETVRRLSIDPRGAPRPVKLFGPRRAAPAQRGTG